MPNQEITEIVVVDGQTIRLTNENGKQTEYKIEFFNGIPYASKK